MKKFYVLIFLLVCAFLSTPIVKAMPSVPAQFGFYGDYPTLAELIGLMEQSPQDIDNKIKEIRKSYSDHPYGYFISFDRSINVEKMDDLELVLQLFQKPYFPIIKDMKPIDIELYYVFYEHDDNYWQTSLRYEIDGIAYNFTVSEGKSSDAIHQWDSNQDWDLELLKDENNIRIFLKKPHFDVIVYNHDGPEPGMFFGVDVRGVWIDIVTFGTNDVQFAFDELLAFSFESFSFNVVSISEIAPDTGDNSTFFIIALSAVLFKIILTKKIKSRK